MTEDLPTALDLPPADPLPDHIAKYFGICDEKLGFVPNVLRAYAFDPAKFDAFSAMYNDLMLADSDLSKLERVGEMLVMNWRVATLDARQSAMLTFVEKTTKASAEITEDDRSALRAVGFTDRDIWDIVSVTGFFNMTNRMASATDMRPNDDYHVQNR